MTRELAIRELPQWSANNTVPTARLRMGAEDMMHEFKKRHGIMLILMFAWAASMMLGCCITGVIVRHNTTERVTAEVTTEMRRNFQAYLDQVAQEQQAAAFLSGDASRAAAIQEAKTYMAKSFYGFKDVVTSDNDYYTIGWNECFRASDSGEFRNFNSIEQVVKQKGQYLNYSDENPVVDRLDAIAEEILTAYFNGNWPTTGEYLYLDWSSGKMIARNEYKTDADTLYWWYGK